MFDHLGLQIEQRAQDTFDREVENNPLASMLVSKQFEVMALFMLSEQQLSKVEEDDPDLLKGWKHAAEFLKFTGAQYQEALQRKKEGFLKSNPPESST